MAGSITIRDVPDETREALAERAALTGHSLQDYVRARLIDLTRPDPAAWVARVRARKASSLDPATILKLRDADRR